MSVGSVLGVLLGWISGTKVRTVVIVIHGCVLDVRVSRGIHVERGRSTPL